METPQKHILIIELNAFNVELVKQAVKTYELPNLKKILDFKQSSYKTNDRYNSGYLEPSVQWTSIHSGRPSKDHQIKRFGEIPQPEFPSFWEKLHTHGISSGIWGVVNGARGESATNLFFFPNLWTGQEKAFPEHLNNLLTLPRTLATKTPRNGKMIFTQSIQFMRGMYQTGLWKPFLLELIVLRKALKQFGKRSFIFHVWFDYISTMLFCKLKQQCKPRVSILFLNCLAHLQQYYWTEFESKINPEMLYGLQYLDKIFGLLLDQFCEDNFIVHNGLSQMHRNDTKPSIYYRQRDPLSCLKRLGLNPISLVPYGDCTEVAFADEQARDSAYTLLKNVLCQNSGIFDVEKNNVDLAKLFYQVHFDDKIEKCAVLTQADQTIPFFELFEAIALRTGRSTPLGTIFSNFIHFPSHIFNHTFNDYIYHYLLPDLYTCQHEFIEDERSFECDLLS